MRRSWVRRSLSIVLPLLAVAVAAAVLLWPRTEVFYSDGSRSWTAEADLGLRTVLWDKGDPLAVLGELDDDYDPCLSADGTTLYFTRGRAGGAADVYTTTRTADGWAPPAPLGGINTRSDELGPAVSPDGRRLVFSSDRPGGLGGYDLYVGERTDTGWAEPRNLGPRVNTASNEYDPALTPDGTTLLFSSNRGAAADQRGEATPWAGTLREPSRSTPHDIYAVDLGDEQAPARRVDAVCSASGDGQPAVSPDGLWLCFTSDRPGGRGGYDLWRSRITLPPIAGLLPPENLGAPVNTEANEFDPALSAEGFALLFSSDREGKDAYSIYLAQSHEVYRVVRRTRLALGPVVSRLSWPFVGLIAALAGLGLTVLAMMQFHRRPGLMTSALLASLVLHLIALSLFTVWKLSVRIGELVRSEERFEISIDIPGLAESELSGRLRAALADLAREAADVAVERVASQEAPAEARMTEPALVLAAAEPAPRDVTMPPPRPRRQKPSDALHEVLSPAAAALLPDVPEVAKAHEARAPEPRPTLADRPLEAVRRRDAPLVAAAPLPAEAARTERPEVRPLDVPAVAIAPRDPAPPVLQETPPAAPRPVVATPVADVVAVQPSQPVASATPATTQPVAASPRELAPVRADAPGAPAVAVVRAPVPAEPAGGPGREPVPLATAAQLPPATAGVAASIREEPIAAGAPVAADTLDLVPPSAGPEVARAPRNSAAPVQPEPPAGMAAPRAEGPSLSAARVEGPQVGQGLPARAPTADRTLVGAGATTVSAAAPSLPEAAEPRPQRGPSAAPAGTSPSVAIADLEPTATAHGPSRPAASRQQAPPAAPRASLAAEHAGEPPSAEADRPSAPRPEVPAPAGLPPLAVAATPRPEPPAPRPSEPVIDESAPTAIVPPLPEPVVAVVAPPEPLPARDVYRLRTVENREKVIEELGGSPETEQAVRAALTWLARHQSEDGRWDVDGFFKNYAEGGKRADGAGGRSLQDLDVTGLATLAFLGAGQTHVPVRGSDRQSEHAATVQKAIDWIIAGQKPDGDLRRKGQMYGQAMATMVLSEAYTMTGDERLLAPLRKAVAFIIDAQNPGLGWRYEPRKDNDTSVAGWEVMALKSAEIAGLKVPDKVYRGAANWLDKVRSGKHGGLYSYQERKSPTPAMTAEGLFTAQCIDFQPTSPRTQASVAYLLRNKPEYTPGHAEKTNLYYWYYASLALHQLGGPAWEEWNASLSSVLVRLQRTDGPFAGSWDARTPWGRYGGRTYTTAIAALTLEVYYRYLPFYALSAGEH